MSEWSKFLMGIGSLVTAGLLALLAVLGGGLGSMVTWLGGESFGINLKTGAILGIGMFAFFLTLAVYFFIKIKDWSLLPAVFGALYAVLPDILVGPQDDLVALLLGAALTGILAWRRGHTGANQVEAGKEPK